MASRKVDGVHGKTRERDSNSRPLPRCSSIAEELETSVVKSQKSGRLRTALTFFGVRKSICLLPSFFGGRNKNQNKKGVCKSKTHDGLCKTSPEDGRKSGYTTTASDFEYHNHKDPTGNCHCGFDCSPTSTENKSLSLPRQRRGLKSLFQSFRHSRNNKNVDKTEMVVMSTSYCRSEEPVVEDDSEQFVSECLGSEPDVPDLSYDCDPECILDDPLTSSLESEKPSSAHDERIPDNQVEKKSVTTSVLVAYKESSRGHSEPCLKLEAKLDASGSSDQLNLIYSEVASLKSFDSLTGCGDIIADQEDDSITESSVSGERSRNGGKRSSCYLTYQGGGEEMASPEDLDESCLRDFWGNESTEEVSRGFTQTDSTYSQTTQTTASGAQQDTPTLDALTPQSEHQESVPNSDEGYYDSTTPGPPEEAQEKLDRLHKERLPRDSYSGDALYELFAPDESLISPHFDNKPIFKPARQPPAETDDSVFIPERLVASGMYDALEASGKSSEFGLKDAGNVFEASGATDCQKRLSNISFKSTTDDAFCEAKEQRLGENRPGSMSPEQERVDDGEGQAVSFSQALVDYTKNSRMMSDLHMDGFQTESAFTANMQALPSIVTFDVVDMHNEGEYEEHIHPELGEDIASSYQELEESYLRKDAFAECDYQMMDLYERSLVDDDASWSVPGRFPKLNRSGQTCRGDAEVSGLYRENRAQSKPGSDYCKKNVSTEVVRGSGAVAALSWEETSEGGPNL